MNSNETSSDIDPLNTTNESNITANNSDESNHTDSESTNSTSNNTDPGTTNQSNITRIHDEEELELVAQNCHQYVISKDYRGVKITLSDLQNVSHILVSERPEDFSVCDPDSFKSCSHNTLFCICNFFLFSLKIDNELIRRGQYSQGGRSEDRALFPLCLPLRLHKRDQPHEQRFLR